MGLDNGIILRSKNKLAENNIPEYLKDVVALIANEENKYEYDICYWRKCWNLRSEIINIIKMNEDEFEKEITFDNIDDIISLMESYLVKPHTWEDGFWSFDEHRINSIAYDIIALGWLKRYLKNHPHDYAYFYDSY